MIETVITLGIGSSPGGLNAFVLFGLTASPSVAQQYRYLNVQIGTVDFTSYLDNQEQTVTIPSGSEIGRATLSFLDDGALPAIGKWDPVTINAGTAAPGTTIWSGYATRQNSEPRSISGGSRVVTLDCQSSSVILSTTEPITRTYGGGSYPSITDDDDIVTDLVSDFLPGVSTSISSVGPVNCDYIQFSDESLRSALNKIVERSGKEYGISGDGVFFYRPVGAAGTVTHQLSDNPNYSTTWPMQERPFEDRDDVEVRNAIKVVGGWTLSATQVETFTTDGILYEFAVAYFPRSIDSVTLDGVVLSVGVYLVDDPADFDVLVHYDRQLFIFQLPPAAGLSLVVTYRYPVRIEYTATDAASIAALGLTLWGPSIVDKSISSTAMAQQMATVYLARATQSIERGQVTTTWVGNTTIYQPGYAIVVTAASLGWSAKSLYVQSVTIRFHPRPGGTGSCLAFWDLTVGTQLSIGANLGSSFVDSPDVGPETYAPAIRQRIATEVFANQGSIGGWTIANGHLFSGSGSSRVGMHPSDYPFYAGSETRSAAPFRVTPSGVLSASSGTVGGWTLGVASLTGGNATLHNSGYLTLGTALNVVRLDAADPDYRMWAGHSSAASAPFRVAKDGYLESVYGSIAGWAFDDDHFYAGNVSIDSAGSMQLGTSNDIVRVDATDGTYRLWAGHATAASAPFRVTKTGALTATSATITGAITANSGSFDGFLTIGTAGGIYQGSGTSGSPTTGLKIWNDGGTGRIAGYTDGTVQWYANTDGKLYAGGGKARLDANGLYFIGASSGPDGATLTWRDNGDADTFGQIWSYNNQTVVRAVRPWDVGLNVANLSLTALEYTGSSATNEATTLVQSAAGVGKLQFYPNGTGGTAAIEVTSSEVATPYTLRGELLKVTDGITAPGTAAGYALIYVDTSDGDLKVKFGDGTTKTIATDS